MYEKVYYDDTNKSYANEDVSKYARKFVKLIVVNKKDLYQYDRFVDRLMKANAYEVKIVEDFSDMQADTVSDDIVQYAEDTTTLLNKYIDELDIELDKDRLKGIMRGLYNEAQDLEL
jgi:ribosome biogenesis GTPase A